ncbi:TPA: 23S rRNA methyltransferase attenuation leader peptide, partial [Streptococcus suis]|nr:23S rRNA methyltransferase attenuation leader peptide [Mycobacterium tuberculosis]HCR2655521.1 23S rRNA methyltransferase attenuation leader peptide [Enterococcus faecium]HEM2904201.1 23S rRNA methyltransferase attenuation leader peptide [Streptococcus suis]
MLVFQMRYQMRYVD